MSCQISLRPFDHLLKGPGMDIRKLIYNNSLSQRAYFPQFPHALQVWEWIPLQCQVYTDILFRYTCILKNAVSLPKRTWNLYQELGSALASIKSLTFHIYFFWQSLKHKLGFMLRSHPQVKSETKMIWLQSKSKKCTKDPPKKCFIFLQYHIHKTESTSGLEWSLQREVGSSLFKPIVH